MKHLLLLICGLFSQFLFAHGHGREHSDLKHWSVSMEKKPIEASFLMFKDGNVYLENARHKVLHFPLYAFSAADQIFVQQTYAQIVRLNTERNPAQPPAAAKAVKPSGHTLWLAGLCAIALCFFFFISAVRRKRTFSAIAGSLVLLAGLYSFTPDIARKLFDTDPAFIDAAFVPFKPQINTFWDDTYFYVESKGIPSHEMMTGITGWQQQVPIPQCYIGNNAWPIPLHPVIAPTPVPVNPQHFIRGAIAVAANGIPIFNPYTNTGVDALLDGQLDNFGGHCGRADDYHYHVAPLFLDNASAAVLPIAFGLDGFAVYGAEEPDGSAMNPLDANHGHYGADGVYHYHGTPTAPYMIGNMVGQVTEDNAMQIIPQAHANPIRPAGTPLQGAVITGCQPTGANGYVLTYTKGGQMYSVDYNWTPAGQYTFHFISPTGTTTQTYNGFVQCEVPTALDELFMQDNSVVVYPNPSTGSISLQFNAPLNINDIRNITIYNSGGAPAYRTTQFRQHMEINNLPKGIYLLKIQVGTHEFSQKLIVQ